uniref:Transposase n=1 Tax=Heterorhabditis bacteriophora TaxID=37862 RepID=A0A1I7X316_HETBA
MKSKQTFSCQFDRVTLLIYRINKHNNSRLTLGIGRELGEYGLEAYTEVKTVTIKVPQKNS